MQVIDSCKMSLRTALTVIWRLQTVVGFLVECVKHTYLHHAVKAKPKLNIDDDVQINDRYKISLCLPLFALVCWKKLIGEHPHLTRHLSLTSKLL